MQRIYELTDMNCGSCVNHVKQALLKLPDITEAEVQLNPQKVFLTMSKRLDVAELQSQLSQAGHYTIKETAFNIKD